MKKTKHLSSKERLEVLEKTEWDPKNSSSIPWCVDLDGTLIGSDVTFESLRLWVFKSPLRVFQLPFMLMRGRAHLKAVLSRSITLNVSKLPFNPEVLEILHEKKTAQERLVLVTAADKTIAQAVASHVGLFDGVLGSDGDLNLRSHAKADALVSFFGEKGFSYMGNSKDDLSVWNKALTGMGIGITPRVEDKIKRQGVTVRILSRRPSGFSQMISLLGHSPWSWAFFIFLGGIVQGAFSGALFLEFLLFLLVGITGTMVAYMMLCDEDVKGPSYRSPFGGGMVPLSMGFMLLGASVSGMVFLLPFIPLGGWAMGFMYGLSSFIGTKLGSKVSGHVTNVVLALVAFLAGLALGGK